MLNTIQIATTKTITSVINFDKIQGDAFIVLTAKWHQSHSHLTMAIFHQVPITKQQLKLKITYIDEVPRVNSKLASITAPNFDFVLKKLQRWIVFHFRS